MYRNDIHYCWEIAQSLRSHAMTYGGVSAASVPAVRDKRDKRDVSAPSVRAKDNPPATPAIVGTEATAHPTPCVVGSVQ